MPRQTFIPFAKELNRKEGFKDGIFVLENWAGWEEWGRYERVCETLASTCGVSFTATDIHMRQLGLQMRRFEYEEMMGQIVLFEQVRTIDTSRLREYLCCVDDDLMDYVDAALGIGLALENAMEEEHPDEMTLCLCPTCASQFYNSPDHFIRRLDPFGGEKDDGTYCQVRKGYDFLIRDIKKTSSRRI